MTALLTPLDDFVLLGGDQSQAGEAAAVAVVGLCELGYLRILHQRSGVIRLERTGQKVEVADAQWIHDTLNALFGDLNDYTAAVRLGDPKQEALPIAPGLLQSTRKRLVYTGMIRRLRPRSVLLWARTIGFVAWMATLAFVAYHEKSVVGAIGVASLGAFVWAGLFMGYLDRLGQRRVFFTRKGKKEATWLGRCYGVTPNAVPYQPIDTLLGGSSNLNRWRWRGNILSAAAMELAMTIMATALNPPPAPRARRPKSVKPQVNEPQAEIAKAS